MSYNNTLLDRMEEAYPEYHEDFTHKVAWILEDNEVFFDVTADDEFDLVSMVAGKKVIGYVADLDEECEDRDEIFKIFKAGYRSYRDYQNDQDLSGC